MGVRRRKSAVRRAPRFRVPGRANKYRAKPCWVDLSGPPWALVDHAVVLHEAGMDRKRAMALGKARGWAYCASMAEAKHYQHLLDMQERGAVVNLKYQVPFHLDAMGHQGWAVPVGKYVADFVYFVPSETGEIGQRIVADVKGVRTPMFAWKKRHMKAQYGIDVQEVRTT